MCLNDKTTASWTHGISKLNTTILSIDIWYCGPRINKQDLTLP